MNIEDDFAEYAAARWNVLVHSAVMLGASLPEGEDLAQTALLKAYLNWGRTSVARSRDAYVHKILVNSFHSSRRRLWWREQPTDRTGLSTAAEDPGIPMELRSLIECALGALTSDQRKIIVLRFFLDQTETEIASTLKIPVGTVKSRLSRAIKKLSTDANLIEHRNWSTE